MNLLPYRPVEQAPPMTFFCKKYHLSSIRDGCLDYQRAFFSEAVHPCRGCERSSLPQAQPHPILLKLRQGGRPKKEKPIGPPRPKRVRRAVCLSCGNPKTIKYSGYMVCGICPAGEQEKERIKANQRAYWYKREKRRKANA